MSYLIKDFFGNEKAFAVTPEDLFILNSQGYIVRFNGLVHELINQDFLTRKEFENSKGLFNDLKTLKTNLQELEQKRTETIKKEINNNKEKQKILLQDYEKTLKEKFEEYQKQLEKKFLLELNKELPEKNKVILNVITQLYEKIKMGFEDYLKMEEFQRKFQEVMPSLDFDNKTKFSLLEIATNKEYWERGSKYVNTFGNETLTQVLLRIRNYLLSGEEPKNILISYDKARDKFYFGLKVQGEETPQERDQEESFEGSEDITDNF